MKNEEDDWTGQQQEGQWIGNNEKDLNDINNNIVNFCKNKHNKIVVAAEEDQQPVLFDDLTVANFDQLTPSSDVSILLGDCNYEFNAAADVPVGNDPESVAVDQFDTT